MPQFISNLSGLTWLGLLAAFCTTIAFVPQAVKTWRTRSAADISLWMFAVMIAGVVLWLIYGWSVGDIPLIVANVVTLLLTSTILYFKIIYR